MTLLRIPYALFDCGCNSGLLDGLDGWLCKEGFLIYIGWPFSDIVLLIIANVAKDQFEKSLLH